MKDKKNDNTSRLEKMAEKLWNEPNEDNWDKMNRMLEKSGAKYYKIFYQTLNRKEDLTRSFARIYDSRMRPIAKLPIIKKKGRHVEGATIYMKNLKNANIFE